jgi:hypothetical protein
MNDPLLPCPFCGSQASVYQEIWHEKIYWNVACTEANCFCYPSDTEASYETEESAIKAWNHRTPPPASMKWPEKLRHASYCDMAHNPKDGACGCGVEGFNEGVEACKELNAVKGEPYKCQECDGLRKIVDKIYGDVKKAEPCEHEYFYATPNPRSFRRCKKCGDTTQFEQPSEKKESEKTVLSTTNKGCKHNWIWRNNMGLYYCENCNEYSYLGRNDDGEIEELQRWLLDRNYSRAPSIDLAKDLINAGWTKNPKSTTCIRCGKQHCDCLR